MLKTLKSFCSVPARVLQKNPNQEILDAIALNERLDPRHANELRAILARHEEKVSTAA
jgi:hypothetical protein